MGSTKEDADTMLLVGGSCRYFKSIVPRDKEDVAYKNKKTRQARMVEDGKEGEVIVVGCGCVYQGSWLQGRLEFSLASFLSDYKQKHSFVFTLQ
jgi:hypothetical protein